MPQARLQKLLQELQQELENPHDLDEQERSQLRDAEAEIHRLLGDGEHGTVRESVERALAAAENAHPQAAGVLRQMVDTLSAMGI